MVQSLRDANIDEATIARAVANVTTLLAMGDAGIDNVITALGGMGLNPAIASAAAGAGFGGGGPFGGP